MKRGEYVRFIEPHVNNYQRLLYVDRSGVRHYQDFMGTIPAGTYGRLKSMFKRKLEGRVEILYPRYIEYMAYSVPAYKLEVVDSATAIIEAIKAQENRLQERSAYAPRYWLPSEEMIGRARAAGTFCTITSISRSKIRFESELSKEDLAARMFLAFGWDFPNVVRWRSRKFMQWTE